MQRCSACLRHPSRLARLKRRARTSEPVNLSPLRPHPEEPEPQARSRASSTRYGEGVSKDGRESEPVAMVRDGAHRSQVYAGCACYGAPPHHEAERVELVPNRPRMTDRVTIERN